MKADSFAILEEESFALYYAAAAAAHRSVPTNLDRGLKLLANLPINARSGIDKLSRKKAIPENLMDRDWVILQVSRIEQEANPKYTWSTASNDQNCRRFATGDCTYGSKCKYLHAGVTPTTDSVSMSVALDDDPDMVEISCESHLSPECERVSTVSRTYWTNQKQPDGTPFHLPKSCKPCRAFKRAQSKGPLVVTSLVAADDDDGPHENDGADDDYEWDYPMSIFDPQF